MPIKIATTELYNSYHKKRRRSQIYSGIASFLMKKKYNIIFLAPF